MWRSSLISRRVLLASILLSKAFAIFFKATCSLVSEFKDELLTHSFHFVAYQIHKENQDGNFYFFQSWSSREKEKEKRKETRNLWKNWGIGYQTMPYAPLPMGMIGGLYLAVTSNMLPKMLYWMNRPPWLSVAGILSIPACWCCWWLGSDCCGGAADASDMTVSGGWAVPPSMFGSSSRL